MEKKEKKGFIEKILGKLFPSEFYDAELNAQNAFTMTRYGRIMTRDEILEQEVKRVSDDIKIKIREEKYSLSLDITTKNESFIPDIKEHFLGLGFKVYVIDREVFPDLPDRGSLLITWKNQEQ
jgi:hypothetical protein